MIVKSLRLKVDCLSLCAPEMRHGKSAITAAFPYRQLAVTIGSRTRRFYTNHIQSVIDNHNYTVSQKTCVPLCFRPQLWRVLSDYYDFCISGNSNE